MNEKQIEPPISIPPTEEEIDQTFELIQDRLEDPRMKLKQNQQVKLGYEKALDVLDGTLEEADINEIKGVQASAIASLTFDYLRGDFSQEHLLAVPLKSEIKMSIN